MPRNPRSPCATPRGLSPLARCSSVKTRSRPPVAAIPPPNTVPRMHIDMRSFTLPIACIQAHTIFGRTNLNSLRFSSSDIRRIARFGCCVPRLQGLTVIVTAIKPINVRFPPRPTMVMPRPRWSALAGIRLTYPQPASADYLAQHHSVDFPCCSKGLST